MRRPAMHHNHQAAPKDWRRTPDMTGSYEMDAVIMSNPNKDMADRLKEHLTGDQAYQRKTSYGGGRLG